MVRKIAHENSVDIDVERNIGLACAQGGQLFLGPGGSEISPMIEDVNFVTFAQSDAAWERPALDFQRGQRQLNPHSMQNQRFLAGAGAPALSDLQREARTLALLEPQNLEAQLARARNVGQCLARVFRAMKHAETIRKIRRRERVDALRFDQARMLGGEAAKSRIRNWRLGCRL